MFAGRTVRAKARADTALSLATSLSQYARNFAADNHNRELLNTSFPLINSVWTTPRKTKERCYYNLPQLWRVRVGALFPNAWGTP